MPNPGILISKPKILWAAWAGALVLAVGWLILPSLGGIGRAAEECAGLKAGLAEDRRTVDSLRKGTVPALPSVDQLPEVLSQLNAVARSHGVHLLEVTPQPARSAASSDPVIVPLDLQVEAEYRSLGEFLGALRETPFIGVALVRRVLIEREEQGLPRLRARVSVELGLGASPHG